MVLAYGTKKYNFSHPQILTITLNLLYYKIRMRLEENEMEYQQCKQMEISIMIERYLFSVNEKGEL